MTVIKTHAEGKQTQEIVNPVQSNMTYIWGLPSQGGNPLLVVLIQTLNQLFNPIT